MNDYKFSRLKRITEALALYGVTDRSWLSRPFSADDPIGTRQLVRAVESCIDGGVTMIQLREKDMPHSLLVKTGKVVQAVCGHYNVPFIVDDDIDAALELNADGVHVGQNDIPADEARRRLGPDKILGVSVRTPEQAVKAQVAGADYLGTGAVFETSTKADASSVTIPQLAAVCESVTIPVVAIGGINSSTIEKLAGTGIAGASVVSALFASSDKKKAAESLRTVCDTFATSCSVLDRARNEQILRDTFSARMQAAIFDMDGTLVDSMPVWQNAGRIFLNRRGIQPAADLWEKTARLSMEQSARYFIDTYGITGSTADVIEKINETVFDQYAHFVSLKPGVRSFLEELAAHKIPIALATATDRACVEVCLERLGIAKFFRHIVTCTETGAGKEFPLVYERAGASLGVPREFTCVFEDSLHAAATAKQAGFPVCAVYDEAALKSSEWGPLRRLADCSCIRLTDLLP